MTVCSKKSLFLKWFIDCKTITLCSCTGVFFCHYNISEIYWYILMEYILYAFYGNTVHEFFWKAKFSTMFALLQNTYTNSNILSWVASCNNNLCVFPWRFRSTQYSVYEYQIDVRGETEKQREKAPLGSNANSSLHTLLSDFQELICCFYLLFTNEWNTHSTELPEDRKKQMICQ